MKFLIPLVAIAALLAGPPQADASIAVKIIHTSTNVVQVQATGSWQTNDGGWSKINETTSINAGLQPKVSSASNGTDLHLGTGDVWLWQKAGWIPKRFGTGSVFKGGTSSALPFGVHVYQKRTYLALPRLYKDGSSLNAVFNVDTGAGTNAFTVLGLEGDRYYAWGDGQDEFSVTIQRSSFGGKNVPEPTSAVIFGLLATFGATLRRR